MQLVELSAVVVRQLTSQGQTISVAESCTGGQLAAALTSVPGSSSVFVGGIVAYSNNVKQALLGVPEGVLEQHGAVSFETAAAMAAGCQHGFATDWAISTTGIAGPDGGLPDKPVGLVWFGWARPGWVHTESHLFSGERTMVQRASVEHALTVLLQLMRDEPPAHRPGA